MRARISTSILMATIIYTDKQHKTDEELILQLKQPLWKPSIKRINAEFGSPIFYGFVRPKKHMYN